MNEIPMWWLVLSGIFFALVAILFVVLCMLVSALIKLVLTLQPQVAGLLTQVNQLVPTVKNLVEKVEGLTDKVEGIADSTKSTVDVVGERAKSISASVDHISSVASEKFTQFAPVIGTMMAGLKVWQIFQQYRAATSVGKDKVKVKKNKKEGMKVELGEPPTGE